MDFCNKTDMCTGIGLLAYMAVSGGLILGGVTGPTVTAILLTISCIMLCQFTQNMFLRWSQESNETDKKKGAFLPKKVAILPKVMAAAAFLLTLALILCATLIPATPLLGPFLPIVLGIAGVLSLGLIMHKFMKDFDSVQNMAFNGRYAHTRSIANYSCIIRLRSPKEKSIAPADPNETKKKTSSFRSLIYQSAYFIAALTTVIVLASTGSAAISAIPFAIAGITFFSALFLYNDFKKNSAHYKITDILKKDLGLEKISATKLICAIPAFTINLLMQPFAIISGQIDALIINVGDMVALDTIEFSYKRQATLIIILAPIKLILTCIISVLRTVFAIFDAIQYLPRLVKKSSCMIFGVICVMAFIGLLAAHALPTNHLIIALVVLGLCVVLAFDGYDMQRSQETKQEIELSPINQGNTSPKRVRSNATKTPKSTTNNKNNNQVDNKVNAHNAANTKGNNGNNGKSNSLTK